MVKRAMDSKDWTRIGRNTQLGLDFLHARHVEHVYPRHSHDYYVISLIERGRQSFMHQGSTHFTPVGGVILINPGAVHTGEAVDENGFEMRSLYPTVAHMQTAVFELTGRQLAQPHFNDLQVEHPWAARTLLSLHQAMYEAQNSLEFESRFIWTLAQFVERYADASYTEQKIGGEKKAIQQACRYIDENFATGVSLNDLAWHVSLSRYYFLRVFREQVGMPPHAYLESVRVRNAKNLIQSGKSLAQVALDSGFSSQSHMTRHFKRIIGVTPGQYAAQIRS